MTFKKGNKYGAKGRLKIPDELKSAKHHTKVTVAMIINRLFHMPSDVLQEHINNKKLSALEMTLARIIAKAIKDADIQRVELMLNRSIGKVTDNVAHHVPKPTVVKLLGEDAALVLGRFAEDEENESNDEGEKL